MHGLILSELTPGITRGVAKHYQEQVEITDLTCMLKGKPSCTIAVKRVPPA